MRYTKWISALMLLFVPIIAAAQMKPAERIVTQVPFKFMVGSVAMPAGEYTVRVADAKSSVLLVGNQDAKSWIYVKAVPDQGKQAPGAALVFNRYGNQYFLAEVNVEGSRTVYTFAPTKLEKELRAENVSATEILLASK